jgi:hypothetical protein
VIIDPRFLITPSLVNKLPYIGETITIQALDIAVTPPFVSNIETVTVPSGTTYGFQNVGALTLFDDNKHAYCQCVSCASAPPALAKLLLIYSAKLSLTAGAQVFCASDVFIAAVPASHVISFPPPFSNILGNLKTVWSTM